MDKPSQNNLYAGLIIYRIQRHNNIEYLLLNDTFTNKKHWFCPKGQVIGNEDTIKCSLRETFEATGLRPTELRIEEGFAIELRYLSGTKAKRVKYHLAQLVDHHTRLLPNAQGVHMQWFNQAAAADKVIFKSMQDAFKHAQTFIEAKQLRPQRKRQDNRALPAEQQQQQQQQQPQSPQPQQLQQRAQQTEQNSTRPQQQQQQQQPSSPQSFGNHHSTSSAAENNPLYKTRLCERYETEGSCPYGPKCHFAHGIGELRGKPEGQAAKEESPAENNQLFKTKLCEKFMRERFCQYGPKCHFAHGEAELKERPIKPMERREESVDTEHEPNWRNGNNNGRQKGVEPSNRSSEYHWRSKADTSQNSPERDSPRRQRPESNREGIWRGKPVESDRDGSWRNSNKPEPDREGGWRAKSVAPIDPVSATAERLSHLRTSSSEEDVRHSNWRNARPTKQEDDTMLKASVEELRRPTFTEHQCRTPKVNKKSAPMPAASDEKSWMKVVKLSKEEQEELESQSAVTASAADSPLPTSITPMASNGTLQGKPASPNKISQIESIIMELKKFFLKPINNANIRGTLMEDTKEVTRIEMRNNLSKKQLLFILLVSLLEDVPETSNILSILKSREHLFKTFVKSEADQLLLLKTWEQFVNHRKPAMVNKTVTALSHWYDCEMVEEDVFIRWYNTLEKGSVLEKKSEKFIEWLNETDEED
ncbi:hypothetical protein BCV72DRAFT_265115 [Rhizopus microsporus var. microsporus]|uniref:Nudix hydrolase domain-containing protein n=1 Tax=Rhizopus microsporus var. microsporus TaxID=86635 RepID=A0A1X0QS31_RHIZD|nr:hypothetical protein BCV72DRAFT_265115 [Rhizopus microsporus var. microsporus]